MLLCVMILNNVRIPLLSNLIKKINNNKNKTLFPSDTEEDNECPVFLIQYLSSMVTVHQLPKMDSDDMYKRLW